MEINKTIILDENKKPVAVQIPIEEFEQLEEIMENYGLAKLMDEAKNEEALSSDAAKIYYRSLKSNVDD